MSSNISIAEEKIMQAVKKNLNDKYLILDIKKVNENLYKEFSEFLEQEKRVKLEVAYSIESSELVLVKTVKNENNILDNGEEILKEQFNLLTKINSNKMPKVLDFIYEENENIYFLVLSYEKGHSLEDKIKARYFIKEDGTIDISKIIYLAKEILYYIEDLKEKDYAHIALTTKNIIIKEDDSIKILGTGRVCALNDDGTLSSESINFSRSLFGYSAPELNSEEYFWGAEAVGYKASIFSLAVIIHQIIIGSSSFQNGIIKNGALNYPNNSTEKLIKRVTNGNRLNYLLENLLKHNPMDRLGDLKKIEEILSEIEIPLKIDEVAIKPFFIPKEKEIIMKELLGYVKSFNEERGYGFVRSKDTDYYLRKIELLESNLNFLREGTEITFDVAKDSTGAIVVCNIKEKNILIEILNQSFKESEEAVEEDSGKIENNEKGKEEFKNNKVINFIKRLFKKN